MSERLMSIGLAGLVVTLGCHAPEVGPIQTEAWDTDLRADSDRTMTTSVEEICDGTDAPRLALRSVQIEYPDVFMSANGDPYFFLNGRCEFWVFSSHVGGVRIGSLSNGEAQSLLKGLQFAAWPEFAAQEARCGGSPYGSVHFATSDDLSFIVYPECRSTEESWQLAWQIFDEWGEQDQLDAVRLRILPIGSVAPDDAHLFDWPDVSFTPVLQQHDLLDQCASLRVEGDDAAKLQELRAEATSDASGSTPLIATFDGQYYQLVMRDSLPFEDSDGVVRGIGSYGTCP